MNKKNILIGGAWPYANYYLHIGHFVALLPGDIIARYHRLIGNEVIYVSGSDCHGTPITQRAIKEKTKPEIIAAKYHEAFVNVFKDANFSYDLYTSTKDPEHKKRVQNVIKQIYDNGYLYEKEDDEDYCPKCNKFVADREIIGTCAHCGGVAKGDQCDSCLKSLEASEVLNKKCSNCGGELTAKKNKHLYFKLSAFADEIKKLTLKNKNKWRPNAVFETKKYLKMGLLDRGITRPLDWGVEVPLKGYNDKRIYVWVEAVLGYYTTCERVCLERGINFHDFIKQDKNNISYYSIGKDNIVFHSLFYPSLLSALKNDLNLADYIVSCEFLNLNDAKVAKSTGNLYQVKSLIENFGCDSVRYYFTINNPVKRDVNFSADDMVQVHNKHLVGVVGNFINRNLAYIAKKFEGNAPTGVLDVEIVSKTKKIYKEVGKAYCGGDVRKAAELIFAFVQDANKYYDAKQPWVLVKEKIEEFNNVTATCLYLIANIANLFKPIIPETADKIFNMLKISCAKFKPINYKGGNKLNDVTVLFERVDENIKEKLY